MSAVTIILSVLVPLLLVALFVFFNERYGLLSSDHFPTQAAKITAYIWFALFFVLLSFLVSSSASETPTPENLLKIPFFSLFSMHLILMIFLAGWWMAAGKPPILSFVNIQKARFGESVLLGVGIGVGGWILTITLAMVIGAILNAMGLIPENVSPSPMIPMIAALSLWQRVLLVSSAMTVEEFFFRGWLQKRVGLVISTIIFSLAHAGYGQPLMLIGITVVSIVIGVAFYRTKNLVPCIVAHGVFDAIQMFVIIPLALQAIGSGS